ncbi:MAG TPA: glycosyltransferase family 4 protein [Pyrinomonadaceae bacterium]|nr:glycosyltransferase family 4 protein [Pyrinomonadaceae bacterium]
MSVAAVKSRALFINSGILGHHSVFNLFKDVVATETQIDATHINLSDALTPADRVARRLLCFSPFKGNRLGQLNLDQARWRQELNAGLLAARRIRAAEHQSNHYDVLHFHTQATAYASLRRMRHTPSIVSIDCTQRLASREADSPVASVSYWPSVIHDHAVFRAASVITSISDWAAKDLRESHPDCADKVLVMPYPVRLQNFSSGWSEGRYERSQRNPGGRLRIMFMGGDFVRKGGADLLEAWRGAQLTDRAELVLVTDWPIEPEDLPAGVSVVRGIKPFTESWTELWKSADVFVMPTRNEAFGMVYQEAAAAGLPAIGTRLNAVPEIVLDQVTGLLVSPGNKSELVEALRTLIGSAELRRRLGSEARRRAETLYSPERYSQKLCALLLSLARSRNAALQTPSLSASAGV